jgi:Ca2+-binding EF-hand superfamily protein
MNRNIILLTVGVFFLLAGNGLATDYQKEGMADTSTYEAFGKAYMGEMDMDGDGGVTWKEFHGEFPDAPREFFDVVDLNKDEFVSGDEWHKFRQAHGLNHPQRYHRTNLPNPKPYARPMAEVDGNGNGEVTWDEFKATFSNAKRNLFGAFDLDRDGVISSEEWAAFMAAHG